MARKKKSKKPAEPPEPVSAEEEIGRYLADIGAPREAVEHTADFLHTNFDMIRIHRVEELTADIMGHIMKTAVDGDDFSCTASEMVLALQHVQFIIVKLNSTRRAGKKLVEAIVSEMQKAKPASDGDPAPKGAPDNTMYR